MGRYSATLLKRLNIERRSVFLYAGDWDTVERHEFDDEYGARNFVKEKIAEDPIPWGTHRAGSSNEIWVAICPKHHFRWEVTRSRT